MAENKILKATNGVVTILDPLDSAERVRVVEAAWKILNEAPTSHAPGSVPIAASPEKRSQGGSKEEKPYFDNKQPANKVEELAVAARFREQALGADATTKEEMKGVIIRARRNFDDKNYPRDLNNARREGLFNKGGGGDGAVLSYYGQNYVDALPDREALKSLGKPKSANRKPSKPKGARER